MMAAFPLSSFALRERVEDYFDSQGIPGSFTTPADVVLALLRINTHESLAIAEAMLGKKITVCPPAVPPWPPKPVKKSRLPVVARVNPRKSSSKNGRRMQSGHNRTAWRTFDLIKRGMTREELLRRGVSQRNVQRWTKAGYIEWRQP